MNKDYFFLKRNGFVIRKKQHPAFLERPFNWKRPMLLRLWSFLMLFVIYVFV